jgi:hypothetical protein
VGEGVDAHHVGRAKRRALGAAHGRADDGVDVLGRELVLEHLVDRGHHRVGADAVADEVRGVFRDDHAFAQHVGAEAPHALEGRRAVSAPGTSSRSFM